MIGNGSLIVAISAVGVAWYSNIQRQATQIAQSKALAAVSEQVTEKANVTTGMHLALQALPDATFDSNGDRITCLMGNRVRFQPIYPTPDALIAAAKAIKPRV